MENSFVPPENLRLPLPYQEGSEVASLHLRPDMPAPTMVPPVSRDDAARPLLYDRGLGDEPDAPRLPISTGLPTVPGGRAVEASQPAETDHVLPTASLPDADDSVPVVPQETRTDAPEELVRRSEPLSIPPSVLGVAPAEDVQAVQATRTQYEERLTRLAPHLGVLEDHQVERAAGWLAHRLHEGWRHDYIAAHRTGEGPEDYEPRWVPVGGDDQWLERAQTDPSLQRIYRENPDTGIDEVDIAHGSFHQLPRIPWVIENRRAAAFAVSRFNEAMANDAEITPEVAESLAGQVNGAWFARRQALQQDFPELFEDAVQKGQGSGYENLSEPEKNKDRQHVVLAAESCLAVRAMEAMDQAVLARPEPVVIPESEVPREALSLLESLRDVVSPWQLIEETATDNQIVKTYADSEVGPDGHGTSFIAQLTYDDPASDTPVSGSLSIAAPLGLMREYYFQAAAQSSGDAPQVYFDEHFYQREDQGRPQINTEFALKQADNMLAWAIARG